MFRKLLCLAMLIVFAILAKNTLSPVVATVQSSVFYLIDDLFFGARDLANTLSDHYNTAVALKVERLEAEIRLRLRTVAVGAYRMHFGNMQSVADRVLHEQVYQMHRVADELEGVIHAFIGDRVITQLLMNSRYNVRVYGEKPDAVFPRTWALMHKVLHLRRSAWMRHVEAFANGVRNQMRNEKTILTEIYAEEHKPKASYHERVIEFASDMCMLIGSVSGLHVIQREVRF